MSTSRIEKGISDGVSIIRGVSKPYKSRTDITESFGHWLGVLQPFEYK